MNNFGATPALPPSNIEVEVALLGAILLDPGAIYQVAETLPLEAFYLESHQDIYKACLKLYKQQQQVDLLTVTNWLTDNGLLGKIGGRNKLAEILNSSVSSVNVEAYAALLTEKHIRRQLGKLSHELDYAAHDTEKPLLWTLDKIESKVLNITQLRKAKGDGYWQKIDDIAFERLCKELDEVESIENAAQRDWLMRKLAKKWKFSNKKELLDFHTKWLDSKSTAKTYNSREYFEKYGMTEQDWLIPGFIPTESTIVLYADGGVGKTRLAFALAKSAVTGGVFAYEGTDFSAMNTLLIETDQGPRITSKLLEMQELIDGEQCQRLRICDEWSVGEFGKLKSMLKQHQPKLVVIDSLTSISVDSIYSENETEYSRPLVRLRHISKEFGCTFLIIHHSNANGDMRGSRAIKNSVDEVWKFSKCQTEIETYNILTIDKTRARAPGRYKFTYDDETWGWKFGGRLEDSTLAIGGESQSTNIMTKCIQFLKKNRGIAYEALEVAEATGLNRDSVRRDLKRAVGEGLVNSGKSRTNSRASVYYLGVRESHETHENTYGRRNLTDQLISRSDQPLITSYALQDEDYSLTDQLINENPNFLIENEKKIPDQTDQLISSTSNVDTATKITDQLQLISCDELISSEEFPLQSVTIAAEPDSLSPSTHDLEEATSPKIEEGKIYWSKSLGKQVKVAKVFPSVKKADCYVAGDATEKPRLAFSDLFTSPVPLAPGDRVEVLAEGKHRGRNLLISSVHNGEYWLKGESNGLNKPVGPFSVSELRRVN